MAGPSHIVIDYERALPTNKNVAARLGTRWLESGQRNHLFDFGWYHAAE